MSAPALYYGSPINRSHPLMRGVSGRWRVVPWYAGGPRLIDLAGKAHGTLSGTTKPTWVGESGGAKVLSFAGGGSLSSYLDCGTRSDLQDLTLSTATPASWAFRLNLTAYGGGLAERNDNFAGNAGWAIGTNASSQVLLEVEGNNANMEAAWPAPSLATWHTLLITHDGSQTAASAKCYIDGVAQTSAVAGDGGGSRGSDSANSFRIGNCGSAFFGESGSLSGKLTDVIVWKGRALSAAEARQLHDAMVRRDDPTLSWILPVTYFGVTAAGGSSVARTAADAPSTADSVSRLFVGSRAATAAPSTSDSIGRLFTGARTAADAPSTADAATRLFAGARAAGDAPSTADSAARALSLPRAAADSPSTASAVTRLFVGLRSAADAPSTADAVAAIKGQVVTAADAPQTSDAVTRLLVGLRAAADAPQTSDAATRLLAALRSAADAPHLAYVIARLFVGARSAADAPSTAEAVTRLFVGLRTAADAPSTADAVTGIKGQVVTAADSPSTVQAVTRLLAALRSAADAPSTAQAVTRLFVGARALADAPAAASAVVASAGVALVAGPYAFARAVLWCPGASRGVIFVAGASEGSWYGAGAGTGQISTQ